MPSVTRPLPALLAAVALAACSGEEPPAGPPGLVLIVVDTLRADHVVPAGGPARVPRLVELARDGVQFPNAFAHAPMTLPAHASLFSSRYPFLTAVVNNGQPLPGQVPMLAEWLAGQGWRADAAVALATLWPLTEGQDVDRGFGTYARGADEISDADEVARALAPVLDELAAAPEPFFLFAHYAEPHEPYDAHGTTRATAGVWLDGERLDEIVTTETRFWRRTVTLAPGEHEVVVASDERFKLRKLRLVDERGALPPRWTEGAPLVATQRARALFELQADEPAEAVLEVWLQDVPPHTELARRYALEVEAADRAVGALLDGLRERGLYDRSLIVFTSDHGEALGEHGLVGHVVALYDEMLHVPLIVKPPRGHPARAALRRARERLVRHVDLVPTAAEMLGLPPLPGQVGVSLLQPAQPGDGVLFAETHPPEAPRELYALRDERFKLVYEAEDDRFLMYDLEADPGEERDVFETSGHLRRRWIDELRRLAEQPAREVTPALDPDVRARLEALGYGE